MNILSLLWKLPEDADLVYYSIFSGHLLSTGGLRSSPPATQISDMKLTWTAVTQAPSLLHTYKS